MVRRPVAFVAAIVLFGEAAGMVLVNGIMATVVDNQEMSLAGLDPAAMSAGAWVMGGVAGVYLVLCGLVLLLTGIRDRAPGRVGRAALISCAVVHGVLGALTVGLIGWAAFVFMMVVLGLIVLTLVAYGNGSGTGSPNEKGDGAEEGAPAPA
ncbi:CHASE2 domain-containing sensor protein [Streptomyces atratus]